jgi:hypothetical protein
MNSMEMMRNLNRLYLTYAPKWFLLSWYQYLFEKRDRWYGGSGWVRTIICRMRNHPCGPIWYNPNGLEPDMHCKNCGDDLG